MKMLSDNTTNNVHSHRTHTHTFVAWNAETCLRGQRNSFVIRECVLSWFYIDVHSAVRRNIFL